MTQDIRRTDLLLDYTNWKGIRAIRRVFPQEIYWSEGNEWHPEPQWILRAFDLDKNEQRDFAIKDINGFSLPGLEFHQAGREPL